MPSFDDLRAFAMGLSGVEESTSYGTPALKIKKKLIARLREDSYSLAIVATDDDLEALPNIYPGTFSIPQHYVGYGMLVIDLRTVQQAELEGLFVAGMNKVLAGMERKKPGKSAMTVASGKRR
jgi:hypothetical protein